MEDTKPGHIYFASESVGEGHPDKLCDQISDGILDACLTIDKHCKVGLEAATKTKLVLLLEFLMTLGMFTWRDPCEWTQS